MKATPTRNGSPRVVKLDLDLSRRGYLPNRFVRRKLNAAIKMAETKPDMSLEEITEFLESVSLD